MEPNEYRKVEFEPGVVLTFYNTMGVLIDKYKIQPQCAPFFFDFTETILKEVDPLTYNAIWEDSLVSAWETKVLIGPDKIYVKGDVTVFSEPLVHAIASAIKKHEELYYEFAKHGFISFLDGHCDVRGVLGKEFNEEEGRSVEDKQQTE